MTTAEPTTYESYPRWIVLVSNLANLAIYGIGAYLLASLIVWLAIPYLIYCLWLEVRVLRKSCVGCYYYGKRCAFGKGQVCALILERKRQPEEFACDNIRWWTLIPDFMVSVIPIIGGIVLLVLEFAWLPLALLLALVFLAFGGTAVIRGSLACKYCRQREIGCPAEKLFNRGEAV